ncbi:MAG: RNA pyrophosphohydrolase [Proteobacteria bacterium]|nr:RNA pyrophosphohydrolase [Pseudomonadota bacterium]
MLDKQGFRLNVGLVIANDQDKIFWGRRNHSSNAWQFPQGGIQSGETEQEAMYRELKEEVGLEAKDVMLLDQTHEWLYYRLPLQYQKTSQKPYCIGQKQKWFLLRLISEETCIDLNQEKIPEFDRWCWVNYWHPLTEVIDFKKEVYQKVLEQFKTWLSQ